MWQPRLRSILTVMNPTALHHSAATAHFDDLARSPERRVPRRRVRRILRLA